MESRHVAAFHLGRQDAQVTHGHLKGAGHGLALRELPDLIARTALQVQGDAGVALLRHAAGIGQHAFGHGVILQDADIGTEVLDKPVPGFAEIRRTDTQLLDAGNQEFVHICQGVNYFASMAWQAVMAIIL